MNICLIPARGGSKRIPRKNVRVFCGKPIIEWPIEQAELYGGFDDTLLEEHIRSYGYEGLIAHMAFMSSQIVETLRKINKEKESREILQSGT